MTVWDGGDVRSGARVPMEVSCHDAVQRTRLPGRPIPQVAGLRKHVVHYKVMMYTMYMGFSKYGDLSSSVADYRYAGNDSFLPEPFLYHVFKSTAETGLAMEQANYPDRDYVIVHRDPKCGNIFLDTESHDNFPKYPTTRLGDFGLAIKTFNDDDFNPLIFKDGIGTEGFKAPEQCHFVDRDTRDPVDEFKLLSHTNVYGIGKIMWCLLATDNEPEQPQWLEDDRTTFDSTLIAKSPFNEELVDLVTACLEFDPADRPSFTEILTTIETHLDVNGQNLAQGMQSPDAMDQDDYDLKFLQNDKWALWTCCASPATTVELWHNDIPLSTVRKVHLMPPNSGHV